MIIEIDDKVKYIFNNLTNYEFINLSSSLSDIFEIDRNVINNEIYNLYKSNIEITNDNYSSILNTKIIILNIGLYYLNKLNNLELNQNQTLLIIFSLLYFEKNYYLLNYHHFEIVQIILQNKIYKSQNKLEYFIINITNILKHTLTINQQNTIISCKNITECIKTILTINFGFFNKKVLQILQILYLLVCFTGNSINEYRNIVTKINNIENETHIQCICYSILYYLISKSNNEIFQLSNDTNIINNIIQQIKDYSVKYYDFYIDIIIKPTYTKQTITLHTKKLHIGAILDGNRRYAKKYNLNYEIGYLHGAKTVKRLIDWCIELKCINTLTLYVFSIDNYTKRSNHEKKIIYNIVSSYYEDLLPFFNYYNIKVKYIGDINIFPTKLQTCFKYITNQTNNNTDFTLNLAIGYSGQHEILNAIQHATKNNIQVNNINDITNHMQLKENIDLVIRTGGMKRSSNFFIWQTSYSEWYFLDKYWPEFTYNDLINIINKYNDTPQNFGK